MSYPTMAAAITAAISTLSFNKNLTAFEIEKDPDIDCKDCKGTGIIILDDESTVPCPCTIEIII